MQEVLLITLLPAFRRAVQGARVALHNDPHGGGLYLVLSHTLIRQCQPVVSGVVVVHAIVINSAY